MPTNSPAFNRRQFITTASVALAASCFRTCAADDKVRRVGLIGAGWYGKNDLCRLIQVSPVEVVSICDVDKNMLKEASELIASRQKSKKTPRLYRDYREMLKEKDLDIVLIGSPDHWHALQMIAAVEAGADVYVQKPISVDIAEGESMVAAARKHKRIVQVGTQRKSAPHMIAAKKQIVDAGLLGKIGHVELCCYFHMRANGNPPVEAVPDFLDYDMWTGPAPLRPYDGLPHKRWWRTFMEYGNGIVGDMCVHMLDTTRWLLGLGWPKRVTSTGGILVDKAGKSNITDTQTAVFEYDGFNAVRQHRTWGAPADPDYPWALFIYGEKGTMKASWNRAEFIPEDKNAKPGAVRFDVVYEGEKYPEDEHEKDGDFPAAPATRHNMQNFLEAVDKRTLPISDIEVAHISTASCILANMSMKLGGRPLSYDPKTRKIVGDDEANQLLRRPYRKPWERPADPE